MTKKFTLLFLTSLCVINISTAAEKDSSELEYIYGDAEYVSIATGYKQPISKAPAVATTITADDIRKMGASDLDDVLESVPGLHIARTANGYTPTYTVRGIYSEFNQQILLLINGIPLTHIFGGDRGRNWAGMPIHNIDRIEIIRGPGSAVYGADAFAGVINIITKDHESMTGNNAGIRAGSFNTQEVWWIQKAAWGDLKAAFSLELLKTDGHKEKITADTQTFFDSIFGSNASLAPGSINTEKESIESHLTLQYQKLKLTVIYQGRFNVGNGAGNASALDPHGERNVSQLISTLSYDFNDPGSNWDTRMQISYLNFSERQQLNLFPANSIVSFGGPPEFFAEGVIGNPSLKENHVYSNLSTMYRGFTNHIIRGGIGFNYSEIYDIKEKKNFDSQGVPLGGLMDVSDNKNLIYILPHDRKLFYAFLQDEWSFAEDWALTTGLRYDHYNDFGETINPRIALVWQAHYNLTAKLLYGRAYRAPSFSEQFLINNPVTIGNPDIKPETIDTIELAVNYQPSKQLELGVNIFAYEMQDIIRFVTPKDSTIGVAQNTGRQTGFGMETEATWHATDNFTFYGNYAFQRSTDEDTDHDAGNAPHHQIYLRGDWQFHKHWHLTPQVKWISERKRVDGDVRNDLKGYTLTDISLRYDNKQYPWSAAVTVQNLFDVDAREPSVAPGLIPNDLPLAGFAIYGEVELRF